MSSKKPVLLVLSCLLSAGAFGATGDVVKIYTKPSPSEEALRVSDIPPLYSPKAPPAQQKPTAQPNTPDGTTS